MALHFDRDAAAEEVGQPFQLLPCRCVAFTGQDLGDEPLLAAGEAVEPLGMGGQQLLIDAGFALGP